MFKTIREWLLSIEQIEAGDICITTLYTLTWSLIYGRRTPSSL